MSGDGYKIADQNGVYYITLTVVNWIDVFTRKDYKHIIVDSIKYCQDNKGLLLFGRGGQLPNLLDFPNR